MGRPREYDRDALALLFFDYIMGNAVPIVAEFAYLHDVPRDLLYQWDEFLTLLKRCTAKKEAALERGMLSGAFPPSAAIFSLKQLGWTDRNEATLKGDPNAPVALNLSGSDVSG